MTKEPNGKSEKKKRWNKQMMIIIAILAGLMIALIWASTIEPCCTADVANKDNNPSIGAVKLGTSNQSSVGACDGSLAGSCETVLNKSLPSVRVEVYHFHRTQQCYSCIRLGELAEKTVNTYFTNELLSGALVFGHINYELPENSALSEKFEPSGSSLWIGTTIGSEFNKEEDTKVWYKLQDEEGFMSYLKGVIDKRLAGDMS
jgi:hypothetical protein